MFSLINEDINEYCENHSTACGDLLYRLWRETNLKVMNPRMAAGEMQGRFLTMIARMVCPRKVIEIGSFTGYSTICLAAGMPKRSCLDTIEKNEELQEMCSRYIQEFIVQNMSNQMITLYVGDALEIIPNLDNAYDLAFIDGDKEEYDQYYELLLPKMLKRGFILVDNVLWNGKVSDESQNDKDTVAIRAFNDKIQQDPRVNNILLPFRDGMMLIEKL
ncbi:MAG: O-methyltransferase [Bacteroidales bacterium]|jgi:predicted O-methyltransferase YrrM|nr:O-methyltransferase [Bacteroidales bacterium]